MSSRSSSPSPSTGSEGSSESVYSWTVMLMDLPTELLVEIFRHLPSYKAAEAFRLCCRQLNTTYKQHEKSITPSIRESIVAPFREYYDFLARLKLPEGSVRHPPATGWPNITHEACAGFKKTPWAVEVLRHLPCIDDGGRGESNETNIGYKSNAVNYSKFTPEDFSSYDQEEFWAMDWQPDPEDLDEDEVISPLDHVVMLAEGYESGGVVLLLDTFTGTVFEEIVRCENGVRLPAAEYCASRINTLRSLDEVFIPGREPLEADGGGENVDEEYDAGAMDAKGEPTPEDEYFGCDEDREWIRHLHRKFGWPGSKWDKEACVQAIGEFADRREG